MATSDDSPTSARSSRSTSRWLVVVPAVALVLGFALGGLVVGVAQDGGGAEDPPEDGAGTPAAGPSEDPGTAVVVPDSCLQAVESVQRATEVIRQGVGSVRAFRAEEIIDLLNELEDLDALARQQAATCSGTTVTDAPLTTETPSPEPPPTTG